MADAGLRGHGEVEGTETADTSHGFCAGVPLSQLRRFSSRRLDGVHSPHQTRELTLGSYGHSPQASPVVAHPSPPIGKDRPPARPVALYFVKSSTAPGSGLEVPASTPIRHGLPDTGSAVTSNALTGSYVGSPANPPWTILGNVPISLM
jgi:hypothetical protein